MKILKNGNALLNYDRVGENRFEVTILTKKGRLDINYLTDDEMHSLLYDNGYPEAALYTTFTELW
jgi:hypothetical protein